MNNYKCPLCGSSLTEQHYHKVLKIQARQEKVKKGELTRFRKRVEAAKEETALARRKVREIRILAKQKVENTRHETIHAERKKNAVRYKRLMARVDKLEEEKKMLRQHTSPQEIGLADEKNLVARLQGEFPDDRIEHVGKGGDVLHFVVFDAEDSGCIVYECKHTNDIARGHIEQTALAKKTRHANYAILVTVGTRKGFSGLDKEDGVFIVAQAGVLTLARICRDSLVEMAKQRLDAIAKEAAAKRLMDYVTSPVCKTPLEEAISYTERACKNLVQEIRQHGKDWTERHEVYQTIRYDVSHIQNSIGRVLNGEEPLKLEKPRFEPLALTAPRT